MYSKYVLGGVRAKLAWLRNVGIYLKVACLLGLVALLVQGCAPVFSEIQSAKLVGKGAIEVTASISTVSFAEGVDSDHVQSHLGLQAAYGLGNNVDFRIRYERVFESFENFSANPVHVIGFGPKIGITSGSFHAALYLPVGNVYDTEMREFAPDFWQFHPTLLLTIPVSEKFEVNPSAKVLIYLQQEDADKLLAINLGAGISTDLTKWAIRPEVGILINPGEEGIFTQFSLGYTLYH